MNINVKAKKLCEFEKSADGIGILRLNRPEKLNALSKDLMLELIGNLRECHREAQTFELRVLLLTSSSERAFCAGADLGERIAMSEKQVEEVLDLQRELMDACAAIPCPTIAVLQGVAFGGGLELALACDLRISQPMAKVGLTETHLAIIPGAGGTQRLSRLIGLAKAKELIFMARRLSATEALEMGLVNCVTDEPLTLALQWAQEIFKGGPIAQVAAKEALEKGSEADLARALDIERQAYSKVLKSKDRIEGLQAFIEKRSPKYQGF